MAIINDGTARVQSDGVNERPCAPQHLAALFLEMAEAMASGRISRCVAPSRELRRCGWHVRYCRPEGQAVAK